MGIKDLTEHRFGRLTVLELTTKTVPKRGKIWLCKCDCGNNREVCRSDLISGMVKSCGCLLKDNWFKKGIKPLNYNSDNRLEKLWYRLYFGSVHQKHAARNKRRGLVNTLTLEEFKNIVLKPCFYCNREYDKEICDSNSRGEILTTLLIKCNGIDRIDSDIGYILSNCIPCCRICNLMKNILKQDIFFNQIKKIYNNYYKSISLDNSQKT